jgi:hypothetical protein
MIGEDRLRQIIREELTQLVGYLNGALDLALQLHDRRKEEEYKAKKAAREKDEP